MKKLLFSVTLFLIAFLPVSLNAQYCATPTSTVAITPGATIAYTASYTTGHRAFTFTATAGCTYTFSTCGQSTADTYLRLYNGVGGLLLVSADDNCGVQSNIVWTCPSTGTYSILMNNYSCAALNSSTRMSYIRNSCPVVYNPCASIPTISGCGVSTTASFTANGSANWNITACGFNTPGQERVYSFTPTVTGAYQIQQTASSLGYVDYFYKAASAGCNNGGWICIDDLTGAVTSPSFNLTAGTQYYFLLDPENNFTGTATFNIVCPPAPPAWRSQWVSMSVPSTWCTGQTQNVSVTVTNIGASTWTDASPDVNIGCKWNGDADYFVRVNAAGLAPNASRTYTLAMTAPAAGSNNITFDVVREGSCWFAYNTGGCGPGNVTYSSAAVTINPSAVSCATTSLAPANGATGVCAQGSGAVSSISWAAASGATLYDVYFGTNPSPPLVSSNQAGTSYATGALALNQLYYWKVVPKNACATATGCATYSFTTAATACGCTNTSPYATITAPGPGTTATISTCQYQSEYSTINSVVAGHTFISSYNLGGFITVRSGSYNGPQVAFGATPLSWTAPSSGTYYIHYNTNSSCGTATSCGTSTIQNTSPPAYRSAWISMSVPSTWCTGVAQNVSVTVRNDGTSAWTNSGPDINIGCKWNEEADYLLANRLNCNGLAPGATQTFTFSMTPTVTGSNNIRFDVVNEGNCWFRDNTGSCGPGNIEYVSSAVTVTNGNVVLNNTGTPAAATRAPNTSDVVLHGFQLAAPSCVASYSFTGLTIANGGSATSADITNLRLYLDVNNSGTWDGGDVLASASTPAMGASISFTPSGQTGLTANRNYILVGNIAAGATLGRTFTATSTTVTSTPAVIGSAAGNTMTIGPANDLCSAPTLLTVGGAAVQGNWNGSSATSGSPYRDVWYTFTPCSTATHTITLNGLAIAGDRDLFVYTSCPGTYPGSPVYSATGSDPNSESITNSFTSGTTYYILAQDWSGGGGTFNIAVTGPSANLALANTGTPATGYIPAGTTNAVLHGFSLTPACGLTTYDFTSLTVANTGSALTSDISNIRVYYDVNNSGTWDGGDTQVSSPQGLSALMGFTITGQTGVSGTRRYLVVGNIASNATGGNTFIAGTTTPTASVSVNGTATGNTLTISPINNDCAGAIAFGTLNAGCSSVNVNTGGATQSVAGCAGTADDDVWFTFTMPAGFTSISFINTDISGNTNRVLQFYSGTCGSLTSLLCSDPEAGVLSGLTPGATYYVRAFTFASGVSSQFSLCIALPPANNDCAGAIAYPTLAPGCTNVDVNTIGATQSLVANCIGNADDDVWYSFVEPVGYTTLTYSMTNISGNSDRVIEFYNSSCGVGSIYCSTNETGNLTGLVGGNTYWVRVYTAANAVSSNFTLCLALPPSNDDCAGAIAFPTLQPGCNTVTANTGAATASGVAAPCAGTADDDVWYSFVIASSTSVGYSMTNVSGNTDRVIQFYSTSCGGTSIYCNTAESGLLGTLAAGTYWVRVFTAAAAVNSEFDLCIALPPANDAPCNATVLASPDLCNPLVGTTQMATASQGTNGVPVGCNGNADDDVWYSFVATSTAHTVTVVGSTGFNAVVQVYTLSGTCPGSATYTAVASSCSNATGAGGTESLIIRGLTIGVTYYVRVHDSAAGASTSPTFTICVVENPLGIPVTYYDFELNSARNVTFESTVEQSVNTATTFTRTGGAFSGQAGAAIAVYGGTINGRALRGTPPDASSSPTTNPSDYIEVALNTSGLQTLSLDFDVYCNYEDYILFQLWPDVGVNYSTDGGSTWNILASFATDWGIWQFPADPLILPASCNNNPNVKIRFYGFNTAGGADFAIDNFTLYGASTSVGAGVKNLIDFNAHYTGTKSSGSGLMYTFDKFIANGSGSTVNLINSDISLSNELKVTNSGTLNFGTGAIPRYSLNTGASAFNLDPTGTIGVTDAAGITTTGNTGNVRSTGVRTYSTAGNYTYIDNAAQVTGNGMPTTVNNLTINNSAGVTITNAGATVNGVLDLTSGILTTTLATHNIIIGATGSVSRTAGWVYANLRKPVIAGNPVSNFEVGNLTNYTPATLAFTGVSTPGNYTVRAVIGQQPNIGTSCLSTTQYVNQYWKLVNGGVSATNYAATFAYTGAELIGAPTVDNLVVGRYNAGWTYPTVSGTPSATDLTAAGITGDGEFQIAQGIVPSVTLAASPSGAVCEGANVTFTATPTNGGTTPNYEFKVNGTQVQTGTGNTYASSTLVTGDVVTVVLTSNANCIISNNIANPVSPITMTVNPIPDLTITNPSGVCDGGSVDITALGVVTDNNSVSGSLSYWTNAACTTAVGTPAAITTAGTYYIKKTATSGGCFDVEPVLVNIYPKPDLVIVAPAPVCSPGTIDLTAPGVAVDANGTLGSLTYYATAGDADAGINAISNQAAISVAGFYYIRKTTNTGGCYDYDAVYADIEQLPSLIVTNPPAVCTPATVDITNPSWVNDLNGTIGSYSYHTSIANANANIAMVGANAISASGTYYIKKTTSGAGCSDVEPVVVTVSNVPNLVITNPAAVCSPATVNITAPAVYNDANGTAGFVNYYPTNADATAGTNPLATPAAISASGTYYIKKTTSLGGCTDIEPVLVTVQSGPQQRFVYAASTTVCSGTSGTIQLINSESGTTYQLYNTTDGANVGSAQSGTGATLNFSTGAMTSDKSFKIIASRTPCAAVDMNSGADVSIYVVNTGTWKGSVSTDWFDAGNWCLGGVIPTSSTDVVIPNEATTNFDPIINGAGAVCRTISINTSGIASTASSFNLDVYGDWDNSGTFTPNTGTVTFKGAAAAIVAGFTTPQVFYNLNSDKGTNTTPILDLVVGVTVNGALQPTNGLIRVSGGDLTLSSATTIASTSGVEVAGGNLVAGSLVFTNNGAFRVSSGNAAIGSLTNNSGSTYLTTGGVTTVASNVANTGSTVTASGGSVTVSGTWSNASATTATYNGSTIAVVGNYSSTGSSTVNANSATVSIGGNYTNTSSTLSLGGAIVTVSGNMVNAAGTVNQTAGSITFNTSGGSYNGNAVLDFDGASNMNISSGNIYLERANGGSGNDLVILSGAGTKTITGGTFHFGNSSTPASQVFKVNNSAVDFNNLTVFGTNTPTVQLLSNAATRSAGVLTVNGVLDLNGNTFTVKNAATSGISATGYVLSELTNTNSKIAWNIGNGTGAYVFPFGTQAGNLIPFTFDVTTAGVEIGAGNVTISTYPTANNNTPYISGVAHMDFEVSGLDGTDATLDRWWLIDANNYTTKPVSTMIFKYADDDLTGNNSLAETNLKAQRWNGSGWDGPTLFGGNNSANAGTNTVTVSNVSSYSPWVLHDGNTLGNSPLPVELVDFKAACNNNEVTINWTTATEVNNDYFTVQRSTDLTTFDNIAVVAGAGNSNIYRNYTAMDQYPVSGTSYYRLMQTDYNGEFEVFDPVAVVCMANGSDVISIFPNPTADKLNVTMTLSAADRGRIMIYNPYGQLVTSQFVEPAQGFNTYSFDLGNLAQGQYLVSFMMDNKVLPTQRVIVSR